VRRILVTVCPGPGKSSALAELARRGFRTVDTDEPDEKWVLQLLAEDGPTLYMSGTVSNQGRFYDRFDAVVLLSAPADALLDRISSRTTNDYGKSLEERELILTHLREIEPLLRATCTHGIDATQPLSEVVERLVRIGRDS
jgi:dephospho-CoA kinase